MKNRTYYTYSILYALFLLLGSTATAQEVSNFTFSHLGQSNGLRNQRIYSIRQTSDGALWFATKNDVERYNGVSIKHYLTADANVWSDAAGKFVKLQTQHLQTDTLYAFDNKGHIFVYDATHDRFREIADVAAINKSYLELNDILPTDKGIWLATFQGIYFLHGDKLISVRKDVNANQIVSTKSALLFCTRQGLLAYEGSQQAVPRQTAAMQKVVDYDVESGFYDPIYNKVWLGGYSSGINILSYDARGKLSQQTTVEADGDISHNPIRCFAPYDDQTILIGIDGLGVYKANRRPTPTGHHSARVLFDANEGANGVLHGNGIYTLLCDIWGNIIVGSYSGGIDIARPVGTTIALFQHTPGNQQSILNDRVNSVEQYASQLLMMGTDNGVSIYNQQTRSWQHACRGTVVLDLCKTPQGTMLAATYGKGVLEVGTDGSSRTLYTKANGVLDDDHVYRLFFDRDGNLWMGCLDGSLVQKTADGCHYYPTHYVKDILQLSDGRIAVGTTWGIQLINPDTHETTELRYTPKGENDVNRYVHTLFLDGQDLWIGTDGGGVYIYNLKDKQCRHLTTRNGLTSNIVNSIIKDSMGRILLATERGLSFCDPRHADRIIGVNYCYGVDREYTSRSAVALSNGNIMLGSTTGAIVVNPQHVQEINYNAKLNITGISCSNSDEAFTEKIRQMLDERNIELAYSQRTFELLFECINLRNQSDIVYQYKVGSGDWSNTSDQQYIRFTNMEPGKHPLMVRSVSRTCGAVLDEVQLTIRISEPWWNAWYMWMVYGCLILLAFYGAWRVYQLHTRYMRLVLSNPNLATTPLAADKDSAPITPETEHAEEESEEGAEFIGQATRLIIDNITDSDFTIDRLCREMAMSRTLFYVKLKSYTGKSPQDFIRVIRLERAAALLRSGHNVSDAAALSGFDNPKYFSTVFKKYFGTSPSKYQ